MLTLITSEGLSIKLWSYAIWGFATGIVVFAALSAVGAIIKRKTAVLQRTIACLVVIALTVALVVIRVTNSAASIPKDTTWIPVQGLDEEGRALVEEILLESGGITVTIDGPAIGDPGSVPLAKLGRNN